MDNTISSHCATLMLQTGVIVFAAIIFGHLFRKIHIPSMLKKMLAEIHQNFDKIKRNLHGDEQPFATLLNHHDSIIPYSPYNDISIDEILPENCCLTDLQATSYEEAIRELILYLHRLGHVQSTEMCMKDIMTRESIASTMLEKGIGMPHARTTQVKRMVSVIALYHDNSASNDTVIIVLTLCPKEGNYPYMQYIAHIASVLLSFPKLEEIRAIDSSHDLRKVFIGN